MRSLLEQDILNIWEVGLRQHPIERAITVLMLAEEQCSRDEALALSVGQRDAWLLAIRESTFGASFAGFAQCQQCGEALEFSFLANDIRTAAPEPDAENAGPTFSFQHEGYAVQVCLPNSAHLLAIAGCPDVSTARAFLLERCITSAVYQETAIEASELPEKVITAIGEAILERDPQAEIRLELACPSCEHRWFAVFDILTFLWQEITIRAMHILRDVHLLASAYGWSERDILAMSAVRRRLYLEMVTA